MTGASGANAAEWAAWQSLGLTADMLPVVSDQAVSISPGSKMQALGKTPSYINHEGHAIGFPKWTQNQADASAIARWAKDSRLGICLIGRQAKGVDIDVADAATAQRVHDLFEAALELGPLPERYRDNSGKRLLAVRCPEFLAKIKFEVPGGIVEILGDNQQFLVAGMHPSGARYEWRGGVPEALPVVSAAELQGAADAVYKVLGVPGTWTDGRARLEGNVRRAVDSEDRALADWLWDNRHAHEELPDGTLYVTCPWEDEHSEGAGAPSSTVFYPAGVGAARRGFKCLHAHCEGRTHREYLAKIGYQVVEDAEDFEVISPATQGVAAEPPAVAAKGKAFGEITASWKRDKQGYVAASSTTVGQALNCPELIGARICYDEFRAETMIAWDHEDTWRPVSNADNYELCLRLEAEPLRIKAPSDKLVERAIDYVATQNRRDSAKEWLEALRWDGVPRVAAFFVSCWGAPDTPYSRAVGRYTWSALAGRVMRPGCKADMAPILVGGQGLRKTSGVRAMSPVPEAFVELDFDTSDKELAYKIRGKLVGELGEMRGMSNRQVEDTKTWLTRETEEWREVFQRRQTRFARRLIVVGTGNRNDLLIDETGNRRWLPMTVNKVDDARILAERDQLWAEGRTLFCSNNHTVDWYDAQHLATDIHGDFRVHDVWEDAIAAWLLHGEDMDGETGLLRGSKPFATLEVMVGALNFRADGIKQVDQRRAAVALRNLGYEYKAMRVDGKVCKRWIFASSEHEEFC